MMLDLKNVLWSTRGQNWGFRFLLKPEEYGRSEDWLSYYEKMFKSDFTDEISIDCGFISIKKRQVPYIALRFLDPEGRRDISGRIIPHEVALFGEDNHELQRLNLPDLRDCIWDKISNSYELLYLLREADIKEKELTIRHEAIEVNTKVRKDNTQNRVLMPNFLMAIAIPVSMMAIALIIVIVLNYPPKETKPPQAEKERNSSKTQISPNIPVTEIAPGSQGKKDSKKSKKSDSIIPEQELTTPTIRESIKDSSRITPSINTSTEAVSTSSE